MHRVPPAPRAVLASVRRPRDWQKLIVRGKLGDSVDYFSIEYFQELARRLNDDPDWTKRALALTAKIVLTVTDRDRSVILEISNGKVTARSAPSDEPADFKFEGPYEVWGKIAAGQTDFNTAVITGKMRFRGSLSRIMGMQPALSRLTVVARDIPANV